MKFIDNIIRPDKAFFMGGNQIRWYSKFTTLIHKALQKYLYKEDQLICTKFRW